MRCRGLSGQYHPSSAFLAGACAGFSGRTDDRTAVMRGSIEEVLLPEDMDWVPWGLVNFMVPQYAPRGTYKVPITIRDDLTKKRS